MTWNKMTERKLKAVDAVIRASTVANRQTDYQAVEVLLQGARAIALAQGHRNHKQEVCPGGAQTDLQCPLCMATHFIEAALQMVAPDPDWVPRIQAEAPLIQVVGP